MTYMDNNLNKGQNVTNVQKITSDSIRKATETLKKYKNGKANLEARLKDDESWYKLQHDTLLANGDPNAITPTSAWLFNSLLNKHADAMDNYPKPNVLPRERTDEQTAVKLTEILPTILELVEFEKTYDKNWWEKLKHGTAVYFTSWNNTANGGLGEVEIKDIDLLNIYWEPGIEDVQKSQNLFITAMVDSDTLLAQYPQLANQNIVSAEQTQHDSEDYVDYTTKSTVVDWYYKLGNVLHMVKFVYGNDTVLFASEDEPTMAQRGLYDHGLYPVDFDTLYPQKGSPVGFGIIAITRNPQTYIDKMSGNILKHSMMASNPRYWISKSCGVNAEQFTDWKKTSLVEVEGNISTDKLIPITVPAIESNAINVMQLKIDELKETSSNRDVNSGSTSGGVTAASAISALQEAGNKASRDAIKSSYRCYQKICYKVMEIIRQFYDTTREFRIIGNGGAYGFTQFSNSEMQPMQTGTDSMNNPTTRLPVYDIRIEAERKSPYSQLAQNEMAKEFYQLGFFSPERAQETLIALSMMDFDGKEKVVEQVQQGQTLLALLQQTTAQLDRLMSAVGASQTAQTAQQQQTASTGGSSQGSGALTAMTSNAQPQQAGIAKNSAVM